MGYGLSPVMRSGRAPVAAVASPGDAGFWIRGVWGDAYDDAMAAYARMGKVNGGGDALSASRESARLAKLVADRLAPYAEHDGVDPLASSIAYPEESDFGERLRYLAAMISKPLGIRVADVEADVDFDTHDNQKELTTLLGEVSECLSAFQADLEARGLSNRVADLRLVRVRAPARGERQRHRPRRRRAGLGPGRPRGAGDPQRVPGPQPPRSGRQPAGDDRLPARLLEPAGAAPRHRSQRRDPARRQLRPRRAGAMTLALALLAGLLGRRPPAHGRRRGRARVAHLALPRRGAHRPGQAQRAQLRRGRPRPRRPHRLRPRARRHRRGEAGTLGDALGAAAQARAATGCSARSRATRRRACTRCCASSGVSSARAARRAPRRCAGARC